MISGPARWWTVGKYIEQAAYDALSSKPGRRGLVPGEVAWDSCDGGGTLAVSVRRVYVSDVFPDEADNVTGRCTSPYEVCEAVVSVIRCAPQPDGTSMAPASDDLEAAAGLMLQDIAEVMGALMVLTCHLHDAGEISDYLVSPAEAQGPEGGCVGFNLTVRVALVR
jgi:hypothetical protein